jgi:hypothetical protein
VRPSRLSHAWSDVAGSFKTSTTFRSLA